MNMYIHKITDEMRNAKNYNFPPKMKLFNCPPKY